MWVRVLNSLNGQTEFFIVIILISTLFFHLRYTPEIVHKSPAFLTTLGILGTFIGIAMGLLNFSASDVQKSVPELIEGVKTAVWASACGILCALTIKLRDILTFKKKTVSKKISGSTIDDLAGLLKSIEQGVIVSVKQALVGKDESSLSNQIKLSREENGKQMKALNQSLDNFCNNVTASNEKALVNALNSIIHDFNVKLNEQFGENFKQLNQASEKMLVWQQQYGQQMPQIIDQQNIATRNMAVASEKYQVLVQNAEAFNTVAKSMSTLLTGLETQRSQIEVSLKALATAINTVANGLPEIEKKITDMTMKVGDGIKSTNDDFNSQIKKTLEMNRQLGEGVRAANDEFNNQMRQMIEKTKEQVTVLDSALSDELTKSLESFGRQLAALSQKFAQDYGPITERLQSILNIAG